MGLRKTPGFEGRLRSGLGLALEKKRRDVWFLVLKWTVRFHLLFTFWQILVPSPFGKSQLTGIFGRGLKAPVRFGSICSQKSLWAFNLFESELA